MWAKFRMKAISTKMKAVLLIFVLALATVYGFYLQPNIQGQEAAYKSNVELFKSLSDYFSQLAVSGGSVAAARG
ncbi:hypothetical protein Zmor_005227 [Zophobas morio]|uniref:Uncharacterized protein n=1 Tax=Zophobas morio TaxID=2755281 RepID=A0AA38ISK5_9CUCU|nr:hypothetical protein Zmor_005227 [Zophobas morio]